MDELIKAFEESVREHAFIGAAPPGAHREIEQDYQESKKALESYICELGGK